jgi:hypothetical protein
MDLDTKLTTFDIFVNNYIEALNNLIDLSLRNNLLPLKLILTIPILRQYIKHNRVLILEYGILYLLTNKEQILNFSLDKLDELDDDSDDNVSRKECYDNISNIKTKFTNELKNVEGNEILNVIIEIKNNSKKLDKQNIELIRNYIKILIMLLEEIQKLF